MLQLFKNENGYEFCYGERSVQLEETTIFFDGRDILSTIQTLESEQAEQKNVSVVLGLEYQNDKYHIYSLKLQLISLSDFKYLTFSGRNKKNMFCLEKDGNFFGILWVSPLEPISVTFGFFTSTITTPQWAILNFGSIDPRTIVENVNISDSITFMGFFGGNSKIWDQYEYPDSSLVEFKVM